METISTPAAWVGCLACYNDGRLVGQWIDTEELLDLDTAQICARKDYGQQHEEFWVMDHEGLMISGECSIDEAYRHGVAATQIAEDAAESNIPLSVAMEYVKDSNVSDPECFPSIADNFHGIAESPQDYVLEYAENCGVDIPSWLTVNWQDSFDNLTDGCTKIDHEGDIYVFSNN